MGGFAGGLELGLQTLNAPFCRCQRCFELAHLGDGFAQGGLGFFGLLPLAGFPIFPGADLLTQGGLASDEELKAIDKEIKAIVNESAEFAKESPEPDLSELWTDITV